MSPARIQQWFDRSMRLVSMRERACARADYASADRIDRVLSKTYRAWAAEIPWPVFQ